MKFLLFVVLSFMACSNQAQVAIEYSTKTENRLFNCSDASCENFQKSANALYQFSPQEQSLVFSGNNAEVVKRAESILNQSKPFKNKNLKVEGVLKLHENHFKVIIRANNRKGVVLMTNVQD